MDTDVLAQAEAIKRRRALLDQSRQASMQAPIQGNLGQAIGQVLAKLGTAYITRQGNDELDRMDTANRQAYSDKLKGELENYLTTMQGSPEVVDPREASGMGPAGMGGSIAGPSQGRPAVAANPREAAVRAITSQLPEVRALGQAAFADLGKRKESKPIEVNGQLIDPETRQVLGDYRNKPEQWETIQIPGAGGKPIEAQRNKLTGKIEVIDKGVKVNVDSKTFHAAQNVGLGEWAKLAGQTVNDLATQARGSVKMLSQLNNIEKLTSSGTLNGPLAPAGIWMGQLAQASGMKLGPEAQAALQNSETFGNVSTELWMQMMNSVGGARGLVKEESERIANNLPSLLQTPQGRMQVVQVMRQAAQQSVQDAKQAQQEYSRALRAQNPELFTFGLGNAQLPNTEPTQPAPGTFNPGAASKPIVKNWTP